MDVDTNRHRPTVAIVTPVFNEVDNLEAYEEEVRRVLLDRDDIDCQVLLVDDGSQDSSWQMIQAICARDARFRGIRLSRNFGSHRALSAGLAYVEADAVGTLAADLQDPPETVVRFIQEWRNGAKIVWGARATRQDRWWRSLSSKVLYWLLKRYAMPSSSQFTTGSFFLIDRKVLEGVRELKETNRIMFALVAWTGFDQATVHYDRRKRVRGASGWTFTKMLKTMYDAFVGFSSLPIRVMTAASLISLFLAVLLILYLIAIKFTGTRVPGWTSQMLLMSVFFGIQFWLMSIVGQYLARIYAEVVSRPLYLISETTDPD